MKKTRYVIIFLLTIILLSGCSLSLTEKRVLSNEQWLEDIQTLDKELKEEHPNIFKYISEEEWNKSIESLKKDVDNLSDTDIILRISQIVNTVGDAHTFIHPIDLLKPIDEKKLNPEIIVEFPIKGDYFNDGFRIVECGSNYQKILGSRLVAINNIDINTILNDVATLIPGDYKNNQCSLAYAKFFINSYDVLKFFNVIDSTNAEFTFENDNGEEIILNLKAVEKNKINYISPHKKEMKTNIIEGIENPYYWYKNFEEDNILYFRYNSFGTNYSIFKDNEIGELIPDFREVQERLIDVINKHDYSKFIIDLRENGGGDVNIRNAMMEMFKIRTDLKGEDIYVITGKQSGSASVTLAWELQSKLDANVVGETTGGNVNLFSTHNQNIVLPNSGLNIYHSFKESIYDKDHIGGVVPDFEVIQTYEDYINGVDTCYEYIKDLDGNNK